MKLKKVSVELSKSSVNKAIKEVERYNTVIAPNLDEVCRRLAMIGQEEAISRIGHSENGNTDATVAMYPIANGYKVTAAGEDIFFIEYGTGWYSQPNGYPAPVDVYPGSYSKDHAQKFAKYGFWYYGGKRLVGTPAEKPMYFAVKAMRENMQRIIDEVFKGK